MRNKSLSITRIDKALIADVIKKSGPQGTVSYADQAEMAIPSYLHWNPLVRAMFWRRYDQVYRLAGLTPEMTVAEFGCGIGVFLPTLTREASKVYAVDLFPQYAEEVAKRLDLDVTFSKSLDSIPDNSLDILFAVEVLEHLDDLRAGIQHIARKIKPGGRLIMSGPTENTLYKIGRFMVGYNKYHEYHHHNVYGIRQAIINNGFDLEQTVMFPSRLILLNLICSFRVAK
jgi:SAM-dependent methyltransferase